MAKTGILSPKAGVNGPKRQPLRDITNSRSEDGLFDAELQFEDFTIEHFQDLSYEKEALLMHEEEGERRQTPAQGVRHASSRLMNNNIVKK